MFTIKKINDTITLLILFIKSEGMKLKMKQEKIKGITLVALVVTIIVLLILAGVAINFTIGEDGIFRKA